MSKRRLLPGILACLVGLALPSCATPIPAALPATAPQNGPVSPLPSTTPPGDTTASPALPSTQAATMASPSAMPDSPTALELHCATTASSLPPTAHGSLVIDTSDGSILIALGSGKSAPLFRDPTTHLRFLPYFPLVSPGGRFIALVSTTYDSRTLAVLDAEGNEVARHSWEVDWAYIVGWVGEDRLQISADGELPGATIVFNPFTGDSTVLSPHFPDLYTLPPYPPWSGPGGVAVYDSSLSRAAYFGYDTGHALFLWGIPEGAKLWRSPSVSESLSPPVWSPDSSRIAFEVLPYDTASPGILTILSRDGEAAEAIALADLEAPEGEQLAPLFPAWSPDGSRIAFWIDRYGLPGSALTVNLGLLDLETSRVMDFCVPGELNGLALPIWSPDGRFIAVPGAIVDTAEFTSHQLPSGGTPIGWLVSE